MPLAALVEANDSRRGYHVHIVNCGMKTKPMTDFIRPSSEESVGMCLVMVPNPFERRGEVRHVRKLVPKFSHEKCRCLDTVSSLMIYQRRHGQILQRCTKERPKAHS